MKPSDRFWEILGERAKMPRAKGYDEDGEMWMTLLTLLDESQEPKALEEKCRFDREVGYCFTHSGFHEAKPQDEPKEKGIKDCQTLEEARELKEEWSHQENETEENKFLKYLGIEPPAIIEGGHSYYVKDEILKAFRQFLKSLEK